MARRESLSEIRAANPDLGLSGNIISVAFNIPYSFTYRKGGDWVRTSPIAEFQPSMIEILVFCCCCTLGTDIIASNRS